MPWKEEREGRRGERDEDEREEEGRRELERRELERRERNIFNYHKLFTGSLFQAMDTFLGPYFHFCLEPALET